MIVDLFAGPGGWSTGLNLIGRAETVGIEWDKAACDTARAAGHERLQADIAELDPYTIGGSNVEGLIASPPCQGFSMAGKGKGREDSALIIAAAGDIASGADPRDTLRAKVKDERSILALEPLRWALELNPDWTAWEQVPAVLPLWEACAEALRADGYNVWAGLVQAEQYGVPQTRKRAILTASRYGAVDRPTPTRSKYNTRNASQLDGFPKWVSMAEALGDIPGQVMRSNYGSGGDASKRGQRLISEPAPTVTSKIGRNKWLGVEAPAWTRSRPAPTVVGTRRSVDGMVIGRRLAPGQSAQVGGWDGSVGLKPGQIEGVPVTVQEAGVLQSFPADYPWQGTKTDQCRQVGDAVPPLMAAHILASLGVGKLTTEAAA